MRGFEQGLLLLESLPDDASLIDKYSLFVLEVVKAHVARSPKYPRTIHYRGDGVFMLSGTNTGKYRKHFRPANL